jgi:hypothetical protein
MLNCWDTVDPSRIDLTAWADLQDLEEGRTGPNAKASHVTERAPLCSLNLEYPRFPILS